MSGSDGTHERRRSKPGPVVFDIEVDPVDPTAVAIGAEATGPTGSHPAIAGAGEPTRWLVHNRIRLGLHHLRDAHRDDVSHPLLLLHGLGERTTANAPEAVSRWPGPIWGLDFTGHGHSTVPRGGGYTAELLMADVDAALDELGPTTVLGRGLGAYVALLVQGARPALVRGAILVDGPGVVGGGIGPSAPRLTVAPNVGRAPDPYALAELTIDVRPPDYALGFLHQAVRFSGIAEPVMLCGRVRPPWMAALEGEVGVRVASLADALDAFAS